ncbi:hypothetical protein MA13_contig00015-0001 [Edwardsiella piscicida]|nr:hypothetical protein MA13_contig00015-0001 [Edwardsiella piscicida]
MTTNAYRGVSIEICPHEYPAANAQKYANGRRDMTLRDNGCHDMKRIILR